jgi:hypothetical protein
MAEFPAYQVTLAPEVTWPEEGEETPLEEAEEKV